MVEITSEITSKALKTKTLDEFWNVLKVKSNEKVRFFSLGEELREHWQKLVDEKRGFTDSDPIHWDDREAFRQSNRKMEQELGKIKD